MSGLPSQTGGSLLPSFSAVPFLTPPTGDLASTRVPSLVSTVAPSVPSLCRDPTHGTLIQPPSGQYYLSWSSSGFNSPGNLPAINGRIDSDNDITVSLPATVWNTIRRLVVASQPPPVAPVVVDQPIFTFVPSGQELIFLMFGIQQDYTFRVSADYPIEYIERGPRGIHFKNFDGQRTLASDHVNYHLSHLVRVSFARD